MPNKSSSNWIFNALGFILGMAAGMAANMLVLKVGQSIVPPPADMEFTKEWFLANRHSMPTATWIYVILAHLSQAFIGALVCAFIARSWHIVLSFVIILLTLAGGVAIAFMVPPPLWSLIVEMLLYIPAGLLGYVLGINLHEKLFIKEGAPYELYNEKWRPKRLEEKN